jgi:hypothetical protein
VTITDSSAMRCGSPSASGATAPAIIAQVAASGPTISWRELKLAALVRVLGGHDTGFGQQRQGIVENAAFG